MAQWGVGVSIVEPGFFDTPILDKARDNFERLWSSMSTEQREEYGKEYIERVSLNGNKVAQLVKQDPVWVVNDLEVRPPTACRVVKPSHTCLCAVATARRVVGTASHPLQAGIRHVAVDVLGARAGWHHRQDSHWATCPPGQARCPERLGVHCWWCTQDAAEQTRKCKRTTLSRKQSCGHPGAQACTQGRRQTHQTAQRLARPE